MLSTNLLIININIIAIMLMFVGPTTSLQCYQCHTDDNRLCLESGAKECPQTQAYDKCMTTIFRKPVDGLHIKKECALAPCSLRDDKQKLLLSFDETCNKMTEDCIFCCSGDGCNHSGGSIICVHIASLTSMVSIIMVFFFVLLKF